METIIQSTVTPTISVVVRVLGGKEEKWTLCLDYRALAKVEAETGLDLKRAGNWWNGYSPDTFPKVVWCGLSRYSPKVVLAQVTAHLPPVAHRPLFNAMFELTFPEVREAIAAKTDEDDKGPKEKLDTAPETWLELWAVARYDLGLSWGEFAELTPSMFTALCRRRNARLKHERFANAETAAAVYNVNRGRPDSPLITPWDFVRGPKEAKEHAERLTLIRQIKESVGSMPSDWPREKYLKMRETIIAQLNQIGRTDAAELWAECWPDLVPEGTE